MALEDELGAVLTQRKLSLSLAESSTAGMLANRITNVSGSSAYFVGGAVTYSNEAKESVLRVPKRTMVDHGAVSRETVQAMAEGCRRLFSTDLAVAITGIAGPTGGTAEKPVGLHFIALASEDGTKVEEHVWQGDRLQNKTQTVDRALQMLLKYLETLD